MEDDLNRRQPQWKMSSVEDGLNGRHLKGNVVFSEVIDMNDYKYGYRIPIANLTSIARSKPSQTPNQSRESV